MKAERSIRWIGGGLIVIALLVLTVAGCWSGESSAERSDEGPTLSRDGKWVAFASDRASPGDGFAIYVARFGAKPRRVTHSEQHESWPAWSPDGSRVVFARFEEDGMSRGGLYVVNRGGSGLRQLTKHEDFAPSWSPDGKTIAFTRAEGFAGLDYNVYLVDADGTNRRVLLRDAQQPAWSPDGSKIAFVRGWGEAIAVFDLKSKRTRKMVRSTRSSAGNPAWSPDGKRIVFFDIPRDARFDSILEAGDWHEIYVVNADGTGSRRLTRNAVSDSSPTWTPDGRIVFASERPDPSLLYVMNGDGTGVRRFVIER